MTHEEKITLILNTVDAVSEQHIYVESSLISGLVHSMDVLHPGWETYAVSFSLLIDIVRNLSNVSHPQPQTPPTTSSNSPETSPTPPQPQPQPKPTDAVLGGIYQWSDNLDTWIIQ